MNQSPGTSWNQVRWSNQSGQRPVPHSLRLVGLWLKMLLHSTSHVSPSRNRVISLIYMWRSHCEGVARYEPKTSLGSFWSDSGRVPSGWRQVREDGPNFHARREENSDDGAQPTSSGVLAGQRQPGGHPHFTEGLREQIYFLCPQFFPLIIWIVLMILCLKCIEVQNHFNPIAYCSGQGRRRHNIHLLTEWLVGAWN